MYIAERVDSCICVYPGQTVWLLRYYSCW